MRQEIGRATKEGRELSSGVDSDDDGGGCSYGCSSEGDSTSDGGSDGGGAGDLGGALLDGVGAPRGRCPSESLDP